MALKRVRPLKDPSRGAEPVRRTSMRDHVVGGAMRSRGALGWVMQHRPSRTWLPAAGLALFATAGLHFGWWVAVLVAGVGCFLADWIYDPGSGYHN